MNVVDIRSDLRMVLDSGPGQAYLLRRGTQAVLVGTFPSLTHTERQFYAQIAGSVPSAAPARVDRELGDDEHLEGLGARVIYTRDTGTAALPFSSRRPASRSPATWPSNSRVG